jgi:DNA repair protein RadC
MTNHLFTSDATGVTRPATQDEILDAARSVLSRRVRRGRALGNPRATREYLVVTGDTVVSFAERGLL